ncbi:MgtC/SapB family protein [Aequorivita sp. SDUM287046]|uniref:MgtC/SapB family protein n=1 Tax=Aequorivita aurantiaca TaxID=3053356 RepID=A0ABT8DGC7_9FLAO|nr:MgtC/SapB family protein [Aequorivita aurantiaca]MDN3724425.1 MgtC/SapB family protein [Aequorivita aurantiaca]
MNYPDLITLGIAFGLGLLVGLQREKSDHEMAGVRTFTLISILGVLAGFLTRDFENAFILPCFGIAITALMLMANYLKAKKEPDTNVGQTTEVAVLLMFAIGSYLVLGNQFIAVVVGGALAVLLYVKETLHNFIDKLKEKDISAIMTFVGISLVILPILPDKTFGPLNVLNPREIWLMVTLIVGISILGYFVYKWVGKKAGMISNGILGGVISSTATTVSYARNSKSNKALGKMSAFVIMAAVTVSIIRVIVEIGIVVPEKLPALIVPFLILFVFMSVLSIILFYTISKEENEEEMPEPKNPAQFKSAFIFGLLYALILLAVAYTEEEFGNSGLYIVSIVGGLAKKDAITLSLAQSIKGGLGTELGWRLIMTGVLANFAFKIVLAAILGSKELAKWLGGAMVLSIAAGLLLMWLWPEGWHF